MPQNAVIKLRRDVAADWTSNDPVLAEGEFGWESDTNKLKVGDGATAWTSLAYFSNTTGFLTEANMLSEFNLTIEKETARTNLGIGPSDSPKFTALEIGHGSDTTLSRSSAGVLAVEGIILRRQGDMQPLSEGGTSTALSDPNADRIFFWDDSASAAEWLALGVGLSISGTTLSWSAASTDLTDGASLYKAGGTDVAITDGGTGSSTAGGARTNLGVGTGDSPEFTAVNIGHASDTTITRVSAGVIAVEGLTLATVGSGLVVPTTQSGTSYTAVLGDAPAAQNYMGYIQFTNAAAIAFTIPPNASVAFPIGTTIAIEQTTAAGIVTLTPGAGVTLNSRGALLATAGQYAVAQVKKVATNTWTVIGDVA
jgi:hypothetical protein